jgi:hypothetical protein
MFFVYATLLRIALAMINFIFVFIFDRINYKKETYTSTIFQFFGVLGFWGFGVWVDKSMLTI